MTIVKFPTIDVTAYTTPDEHLEAIVDYGTLLCVLVANPDAEACLDQINRVLWLIVGHARTIQNRPSETLVSTPPTRRPFGRRQRTAAEPLAVDHRAILDRVEQIVDLLRTRYVCDGWKMDEAAAARALDYYRRRVYGPPFKDEKEDTAAYHLALEFLSSHGQNLDWVHIGNPGGMICELAHHSHNANGST